GLPVSGGRGRPRGVVIAGPRRTLRIGADAPIAVIGERINPTGKPELAESLRAGSMSVVRRYADEQTRAGAAAIDVNVGAAGVDAAAVLRSAVLALAASSDAPLVLDNTDAVALESALRVYPGRALINSVNGGEESLSSVLPLARRYGAAVVVLALGDDGIPADAAGRLEVVDRVRSRAHEAGLRDADLVVDPLVMAAATDVDAPRVTIDVLRGAAGLGLATVAGISNVSHGLPSRPELNAAFVAVASAAGLNAAIVNPQDTAVRTALERVATVGPAADGERALAVAWAEWDAAYDRAMRRAAAGERGDAPPTAGVDAGSAAERLQQAMVRGDRDAAPGLVDAVIAEGTAAERVIGEVLTPAIQLLGEAFGRGEAFLPQLIVAAEAMKAAVARVRAVLPAGVGAFEGRVVFATVAGDIHSIGKDICVSLLESQGFDVEDLGVDVPAHRVASSAGSADAVCLSALMTTTLPAMAETVRVVRETVPDLPVLVGGAVVTGSWAASIGAGYSDDAPGCVRAVRDAMRARRMR
ncbi:MAG TPA: cobalamin-dependent protein, partial [Coriobacteriia bacterium]|nr:cobalamin-dependent protein [Coriobacteriia bacterium]